MPRSLSMRSGGALLWASGLAVLAGLANANCQIDTTSRVPVLEFMRQLVDTNLPPRLPRDHAAEVRFLEILRQSALTNRPRLPPLPPTVLSRGLGNSDPLRPPPPPPPASVPPEIRARIQAGMSNLHAADSRRWADHETNMLLWEKVRQAREYGPPEAVPAAEQALADYLAAMLPAITHKTYPPHMSLAAVMTEIRALNAQRRSKGDDGSSTNRMTGPAQAP
jgi:hypothetical protein